MTNKTQCDYCAFLLIEDQSTTEKDNLVEEKYTVLRKLKGAPRTIRHMHAGNVHNPENNRTETCIINSKSWVKNKTSVYCKERIDNNLSLSEALALREAQKGSLIAAIAVIATTAIAVIAMILT